RKSHTCGRVLESHHVQSREPAPLPAERHSTLGTLQPACWKEREIPALFLSGWKGCQAFQLRLLVRELHNHIHVLHVGLARRDTFRILDSKNAIKLLDLEHAL